MSNTRVLITGGSSFLGGHIIKKAQGRFNVTATFHKNLPLHSDNKWLQLDLNQPSELEAKIYDSNPRIIIHNAACTDVDWCEQNKTEAEEVNVRSSRFISRLAKRIGARIIYVSTDLVFNGEDPPYDESASPTPMSHYGWSKWQGELAVSESNPDYVIVRPSIIYGPPAILGTSFSEWMIGTWKAGERTYLFADQYRTPVFAGNLAEAIVEFADNTFRGVVHIGGSERINRWDFGLRLSNHLGFEPALIEKSTMAKANLVGKRPADVSLTTDLAKGLVKTRLLDCSEGIRTAYAHGA